MSAAYFNPPLARPPATKTCPPMRLEGVMMPPRLLAQSVGAEHWRRPMPPPYHDVQSGPRSGAPGSDFAPLDSPRARRLTDGHARTQPGGPAGLLRLRQVGGGG